LHDFCKRVKRVSKASGLSLECGKVGLWNGDLNREAQSARRAETSLKERAKGRVMGRDARKAWNGVAWIWITVKDYYGVVSFERETRKWSGWKELGGFKILVRQTGRLVGLDCTPILLVKSGHDMSCPYDVRTWRHSKMCRLGLD